MIESPPHAATTIAGLLDTGMKAISTTISNAFPNMPAHAVALLKTLPLSMTVEMSKHANSIRRTPERLCPSASSACPAAVNRDLCTAVVAAAYCRLRESMGKARLLAM